MSDYWESLKKQERSSGWFKDEYPKFQPWESDLGRPFAPLPLPPSAQVNPFFDKYESEAMPAFLNPMLNSNAVPRNQFGQPLYSSKCTYCLEHQDSRDVCDLCSKAWITERTHSRVIAGGAIPSVGQRQWTDIFQHECSKTHQYLMLLLCAIL